MFQEFTEGLLGSPCGLENSGKASPNHLHYQERANEGCSGKGLYRKSNEGKSVHCVLMRTTVEQFS